MARAGRQIDGLKVARARQQIRVSGKPMTQAAFASRLGIHWTTMNRIENGHARVSLELVERIAGETGESREHFLVDEDEEEAAPVLPSLVRQRDILETLHAAIGEVLNQTAGQRA